MSGLGRASVYMIPRQKLTHMNQRKMDSGYLGVLHFCSDTSKKEVEAQIQQEAALPQVMGAQGTKQMD